MLGNRREKGYSLLPLTGGQPERLPYHYVAYFLLTASNILFLGLWLFSGQMRSDCIRPQLSYSPAKDDGAITYVKKHLMRDIEHNPFTGEPRTELDAAWRHILEPMTTKISAEELAHLPDTSIPFADGSGYIAELAVYHELHCVKRVRRFLHLSHYMPNITADELVRENTHIDHCLEYWREAAMCRGDTTLATFRWKDGLPYSRVYSDHECVDWEALDGWARGRMVDMSDYSILKQD
ncbi:hypothetical protein BDW60DRAFT_132426 [Aspergillus nidulans var. acristatus]